MIAEAVGLGEWVFKPLGLISLLGKSINLCQISELEKEKGSEGKGRRKRGQSLHFNIYPILPEGYLP